MFFFCWWWSGRFRFRSWFRFRFWFGFRLRFWFRFFFISLVFLVFLDIDWLFFWLDFFGFVVNTNQGDLSMLNDFHFSFFIVGYKKISTLVSSPLNFRQNERSSALCSLIVNKVSRIFHYFFFSKVKFEFSILWWKKSRQNEISTIFHELFLDFFLLILM